MNLFKWAKQQIAEAFGPKAADKPSYAKTVRPIHSAKAEALNAVEKMRADRKRLERTKAFRRKWTWFHVSKWPTQIKNPKTGLIEVRWLHQTYRRTDAA